MRALLAGRHVGAMTVLLLNLLLLPRLLVCVCAINERMTDYELTTICNDIASSNGR